MPGPVQSSRGCCGGGAGRRVLGAAGPAPTHARPGLMLGTWLSVRCFQPRGRSWSVLESTATAAAATVPDAGPSRPWPGLQPRAGSPPVSSTPDECLAQQGPSWPCLSAERTDKGHRGPNSSTSSPFCPVHLSQEDLGTPRGLLGPPDCLPPPNAHSYLLETTTACLAEKAPPHDLLSWAGLTPCPKKERTHLRKAVAIVHYG